MAWQLDDTRQLSPTRTYYFLVLAPAAWAAADLKRKLETNPPGIEQGTFRVLKIDPGSTIPDFNFWRVTAVWYGIPTVMPEKPVNSDGVEYPEVYVQVPDSLPTPPSPQPPSPLPPPSSTSGTSLTPFIVGGVLLLGTVAALIYASKRGTTGSHDGIGRSFENPRWAFDQLLDALSYLHDRYMETVQRTPKSGVIVWTGNPPMPTDKAVFEVWQQMREMELELFRESGWTEEEYDRELDRRLDLKKILNHDEEE